MISQFSCVFTSMTDSDKQSFCACAIAKFREYSFKHKIEDISDIKKYKLKEFRRIVCWMSGKHYYFLVNTFCPILCHKNKIL